MTNRPTEDPATVRREERISPDAVGELQRLGQEMTNPTPEEIIAKAACGIEEGSETNWLIYCGDAARHIKALTAAGYVIVPIEPTAAQIQAACDATFGPTPLTPEEMHAKGYRAMTTKATP